MPRRRHAPSRLRASCREPRQPTIASCSSKSPTTNALSTCFVEARAAPSRSDSRLQRDAKSLPFDPGAAAEGRTFCVHAAASTVDILADRKGTATRGRAMSTSGDSGAP